jgi:phage terminase large subunit-like protein
MQNSWDKYAADIVSGDIVACQQVQQTAARYLADMRRDDIEFHPDVAERVVLFFERILKHSKGEWAGDDIDLEPWEQFILANVFGWYNLDGTRRFRTSYVEIARKNGKTLLASGVGLYMMLLDGEGGAEVYSAATTREQARLSHGEAVRMVRQSSLLQRELKTVRDNIYSESTFSKFEPLSADYGTLDGLNVHCALCDEVHAWKGRALWDILRTATGARRNPLMFAITTAGFDRQSLCYQLHDYTEKVLAGVIEDDTHFGIIYTIDEGDDWENEANWIKANPNIDVSKKREDMRIQAAQAKEMPAALNAFLRLHLNVWTQAEDRWISPHVWAENDAPLRVVEKMRCYGGLDLSTTTDISAFVLVFPDGDEFAVLPHFFIPEDNMHDRERRDRVPFSAWVRAGYVTATPGNVIDYAYILDHIEQMARTYDLQKIAFDRWGATQIVTQMQERGLRPVEFGQGYASMSPPMKELEKLLLGGKIRHGGNPVLAWMADNVVARQDPAGNVKPDKQRSIEKIDGIVAFIMALDQALRYTDERSVYQGRGLRVL